MKFTTTTGRSVSFDDGELTGDPFLVEFVQDYIKSGTLAGCNYWGEVEPGLGSDWQAYLTICGALAFLFVGQEPVVDEIPENPDGYEPEGPR